MLAGSFSRPRFWHKRPFPPQEDRGEGGQSTGCCCSRDILPLGQSARGCRAEGSHAAGRARVQSSGALVLHQVEGGLHPCHLLCRPSPVGGRGEGGMRGVLTRGPGDATLAQTRLTSKFIPVCGLSGIYHTPALIIREKDTLTRSEERPC